MNISQVVYYESIAEVEDLSSEAKQVIQDNYDAMDELEDYIEETIGTRDNDGVVSVDISALDDYLTYEIKEDKKAQEILERNKPKYELVGGSKLIDGTELYRIVALKNFGNVQKGAIGGYVESMNNLSQEGNCWIYDDAKVTGMAYVYDDAEISGNAIVSGQSIVSGNAKIQCKGSVLDHSKVKDYAIVQGIVYDNAVIKGKSIINEGASIGGQAILSGESVLGTGTIIE